MPDNLMEWYHCGRCGALFQSPPGDPDERFCAKCGKDPSLGTDPGPQRASVANPAAAPREADDEGTRERHHSSRSRTRNLATMLAMAWIVVLALVVVTVKILWPEGRDQLPEDPSVADQFKGTSGDATVIKLDQALPGCVAAFNGFIASGTMEERNQFVADPVTAAQHMNRFYASSAPPRIDPEGLITTEKSLLNVRGRQAIEIRWQAASGLLLDSVFYKRDDDWLLDWEHFARYQECPWSLYTIGEGPEEAEFRLLARRRLSRGNAESSTLNLVLAPPRFGRPRETGNPFISVALRLASPEGKLLDAAFKQLADSAPPFGSTLKSLEGEGMLRVRVRLRRSPNLDDATEKWKYDLTKVTACHWLNTDDPGVKVETKAK